MKKLFFVFALVLLSASLSTFTVNADDAYPPQGSGASESKAIKSDVGEESAIGSIQTSRKKRGIEFVDNWSIHYCLTASKGKITGKANGAQSCGYTGTFNVSGTYKGKRYKFTVTNPMSCDLQFYIVEGVADKKFKKARTGPGTYDWNGDGVDGTLNLAYEGRCRN